MTFTKQNRLDTGDSFPEITFNSITGYSFNMPKDFDGSWGIVLLYRGEWWPFCRQQLADFQEFADDFQKLDVRLMAASADSLEAATKVVRDYQLTFPVAHSVDAKEISSLTGSYYDENKDFVHASGFLFNRNGTIIVASYSTGSIGRLTPQNCIALITQLQAERVTS